MIEREAWVSGAGGRFVMMFKGTVKLEGPLLSFLTCDHLVLGLETEMLFDYLM